MARADAQPAVAAGSIVLPLALAQFIASYAGSNMNVAISTIADDIGTTVIGDADGDHAVHPDDGVADDPRQQADATSGAARSASWPGWPSTGRGR